MNRARVLFLHGHMMTFRFKYQLGLTRNMEMAAITLTTVAESATNVPKVPASRRADAAEKQGTLLRAPLLTTW